jgi:hypothetical protein
MGDPGSDLALDLDGFLAWEERQRERVDGVVWMMAGGHVATA